eukprot:872440_1
MLIMTIQFIVMCFNIWLSRTQVFEIDGPDGPIFHWFPNNSQSTVVSDTPALLPTTPPTNRPTLLPTNNPTLLPTQHPTNRPTLPPTRKPSRLRTRKPTTARPTRTPTNTPTTIAPTISWDKRANKHKKKKTSDDGPKSARMASKQPSLDHLDDSLLPNPAINDHDHLELFVLSHDVLLLREFEKHLVSKRVHDLVIIRNDFESLATGPTHSNTNAKYIHSATDIAFDHIASILNDLKDNPLCQTLICDVIDTIINVLFHLNQSIFERIFAKLSQYQDRGDYGQYAYYYTKTSFARRVAVPNHRVRRVSMNNGTVAFALDLFMYSFQTLFGELWNDVMHTLQHTEYGQSDKIHPLLKNGWDQYEVLVNEHLHGVLPRWLNNIRLNGPVPCKELITFCNLFNGIKDRIDTGKIIYDFKYAKGRKGPSVVAFSSRALFPEEFSFLHHLGYDPEFIRSFDVKGSFRYVNRREKRFVFETVPSEHSINVKTHKKQLEKKKRASRSMGFMNVTDAIAQGNDTIRIYEAMMDARTRLEFEHRLVYHPSHANQVIFIRHTWLHEDILKDDERIRSMDTFADLLFQVGTNYVEKDYAEEDMDRWLSDIISILSMMDASVFDGIYNILDTMYPHKTVTQLAYFEHVKRLYDSCFATRDRQKPSVMTLITTKPDLADVEYDLAVADMEMSLFAVIMSHALNMKTQRVVHQLTESVWAKSGKVSNMSALLEQANEFNRSIAQLLDEYTKDAKEIMNRTTSISELYQIAQTLNASDIRAETEQADELLDLMYDFGGWSRCFAIASAVYELKYVEHVLDKDTAIEVFDTKYSDVLDTALYDIGYRDARRRRKYKVIARNQTVKKKMQLVFQYEEYL